MAAWTSSAVAYRPSCGIPAVTFPLLWRITMSSSSMRLMAIALIFSNQRCKPLIKDTSISRLAEWKAYCLPPIVTAALVVTNGLLFEGVYGSLKFGNNAFPVSEQAITSQMRHARRDVHLQTPHVGEVRSSATRRKDPVIEQDIGVDFAREDNAGHQQISAYDANAFVARPQTIRKLLWKHNERSAAPAS